MKLQEYQDLYQRLSTPEDIDFLAENFGYDKELLLVIYTQRIVRDTTKRFYRVKAQARRLAFEWQHGASLLQIARRFYWALGGHPAIPLMEDVALARRIGRRRLAILEHRAITSAARYRRDGWLLRPARNLALVSLYFLGVPPRLLARLYGR